LEEFETAIEGLDSNKLCLFAVDNVDVGDAEWLGMLLFKLLCKAVEGLATCPRLGITRSKGKCVSHVSM
jgi:hypothetical protein